MASSCGWRATLPPSLETTYQSCRSTLAYSAAAASWLGCADRIESMAARRPKYREMKVALGSQQWHRAAPLIS